jgi:carbon storage regulator CsrA
MGNLILTRKPGERIFIDVDGRRVTITLVEIKSPDRARIGVEADRDIQIMREEIDGMPPRAPRRPTFGGPTT